MSPLLLYSTLVYVVLRIKLNENPLQIHGSTSPKEISPEKVETPCERKKIAHDQYTQSTQSTWLKGVIVSGS